MRRLSLVWSRQHFAHVRMDTAAAAAAAAAINYNPVRAPRRVRRSRTFVDHTPFWLTRTEQPLQSVVRDELG